MSSVNDYGDGVRDTDIQQKPSFEETLEALKKPDSMVLSRTLFYGLSDLSHTQVRQLGGTWNTLNPEARLNILSELVEASETNFEFDYRELGLFALDDSDGDVRAKAVELLWEDETIDTMGRLIDLTQWDETQQVRAAAASALGRYILLGEYEKLPAEAAQHAQEAVINLLVDDDEELDVRRRALESLANSSHEMLEEAIQEAYASSEQKMKASAIYAMGRSYDSKWRDTILKELSSPDSEIRYEAVRAAGELELDEAVPNLGQLAVQEEREVQEVAIWSLGEIGGRQALRILSALAEDAEQAEDETLLEAIEDAIGNASLVGDQLELDDL